MRTACCLAVSYNAGQKAKGMQQLFATYCSRQGGASPARQLHTRQAPVAACSSIPTMRLSSYPPHGLKQRNIVEAPNQLVRTTARYLSADCAGASAKVCVPAVPGERVLFRQKRSICCHVCKDSMGGGGTANPPRFATARQLLLILRYCPAGYCSLLQHAG
jgi:hypothetical protein